MMDQQPRQAAGLLLIGFSCAVASALLGSMGMEVASGFASGLAFAVGMGMALGFKRVASS